MYDDSKWSAEAGFRTDQTTRAGNVSNYRISGGRSFASGTKLSATYGTAFKPPSLFQLYSKFGNQDLKSENAGTFELSVSQQILDQGDASLTYFRSRFRDLIDFDIPNNKYFNVSSARSWGFEAQGAYRIFENLKLSATYTYLNAHDDETGLRLLRRPENSWTASATYIRRAFEGSVLYRHKGQRPDVDPVTFQRIMNDPYDLVGLAASYEFFKELKVHLRIENLFDTKYEEVAGYGVPALSYYLGISGSI
jgi:vitamin B12 transporter